MPLLTVPTEHRSDDDQARELRALVARRAMANQPTLKHPPRLCRSLAVVGSKGGVGKSVITLNLARAFATQGMSAAMLDASPGAGALGLLRSQNGYWNLEHVAAGTRPLDDVILTGSGPTPIIPGASHLLTSPIRQSIWRALAGFERRHDWLIVDTGADLTQAQRFAAPADLTLVVTTPEPTSVAEAYAAIKKLAVNGVTTVSVIVNQADSQQQAQNILDRLRQAVRAFLASDIGLAGFIPFDPMVGQSVFRRSALIEVDRDCPALLAMEQIGQRLQRTVSRQFSAGYMETLGSRFAMGNG